MMLMSMFDKYIPSQTHLPQGEAKSPYNGASRMMLISWFKNILQNTPRQGEAEPPDNGASRVCGWRAPPRKGGPACGPWQEGKVNNIKKFLLY